MDFPHTEETKETHSRVSILLPKHSAISYADESTKDETVLSAD